MSASRAGAALAMVAALLGGTRAAQAQSGPDPLRAGATRQELQTLLGLYEQAAASSAYSDSFRLRARAGAVTVRARLEEGDFEIGDRVTLSVEGMQQLSETFVVTERRTLRLPLVREISLAGVLRSELEDHLRTELSRFVNDPQVEAQALTRIAIMGAVPRPGFYTAASDLLIGDALMLAGGPGSNIPLDRVRIERAGEEVISGQDVEVAIAEGRTLEDLDIRSGDQVRVRQPSRWWGSIQSSLSWLTMLTSIPITIFTVTRLF